jgi:hypothetical protein
MNTIIFSAHPETKIVNNKIDIPGIFLYIIVSGCISLTLISRVSIVRRNHVCFFLAKIMYIVGIVGDSECKDKWFFSFPHKDSTIL